MRARYCLWVVPAVSVSIDRPHSGSCLWCHVSVKKQTNPNMLTILRSFSCWRSESERVEERERDRERQGGGRGETDKEEGGGCP